MNRMYNRCRRCENLTLCPTVSPTHFCICFIESDKLTHGVRFRSAILIPNLNPIPNPSRAEPNNFSSNSLLIVSGRGSELIIILNLLSNYFYRVLTHSKADAFTGFLVPSITTTLVLLSRNFFVHVLEAYQSRHTHGTSIGQEGVPVVAGKSNYGLTCGTDGFELTT